MTLLPPEYDVVTELLRNARLLGATELRIAREGKNSIARIIVNGNARQLGVPRPKQHHYWIVRRC